MDIVKTGQLVFWAITIVLGLITAWKGIRELRLNTESRDRELRWKAAATAKELISEIHHSFYASTAVAMLDWWGCTRTYPVLREGVKLVSEGDAGGRVQISTAEIREALEEKRGPAMTEKNVFIRDCFDWFFYYVDRLEHYAEVKLVYSEDVFPVFAPYVKLMAAERETFRPFVEGHEYPGAMRFFKL
jgi:hypothetical protein